MLLLFFDPDVSVREGKDEKGSLKNMYNSCYLSGLLYFFYKNEGRRGRGVAVGQKGYVLFEIIIIIILMMMMIIIEIII